MILVEKVKDLPWHEQKAAEYYLSLKGLDSRAYSFETLTRLFANYQAAQLSGRQLSLEELSESIDRKINSPQVGRLLRIVGIAPLYGKRDRHATPAYKKEAMQRAFALDMPSTDIAYFLGMSDYNVRQKFTATGKRPHAKRLIAETGSKYGRHISYRLASEVYEAVDAGFKKREICKLVDVNVEVVDYAIENRGVLQEKIIHALRVMYPDRTIIRPYLSGAQ
jgi:hypothetical protein